MDPPIARCPSDSDAAMHSGFQRHRDMTTCRGDVVGRLGRGLAPGGAAGGSIERPPLDDERMQVTHAMQLTELVASEGGYLPSPGQRNVNMADNQSAPP